MEEEAFYGSGTNVQGTHDWRVRAKPATFGIALTIESGPSNAETVVTLPLTIARTRALRRLLAAALMEAGEAIE